MNPEQLDLFDMTFGSKPAEQNSKEVKVPVVKKQTMKIIKAVEGIRMSPRDGQIDYLHTILCQVGMPRSETKELLFERRNGQAYLGLEAGKMLQLNGQLEQQPLPYGAKPRLIMIHITSEAVKNKNKIVDVGSSVREFLTTLGIDINGRGYKSFRQQMNALAVCRMIIGRINDNSVVQVNTQPIRKFEAWATNESNQSVLWTGKIELTEEYYQAIGNSAVPLDREAIRALHTSALKLDIYTWLAQRLCRINDKRGLVITWDNLKDQFGVEYSRGNNFKRDFSNSLKSVLAVYSTAKVSSVENGLLLKPSAPPISKTRILIDNNA